MNSTEWSQLIEKHFDHYKHIVGLYIRNIMEISVAMNWDMPRILSKIWEKYSNRNQHLKRSR